MSKQVVQTRNTDAKGRLTLGEAYANRTVLVQQRGNELIFRLARVIPEQEAWLHDNKEALASVRNGLRQARAGKFAEKGPDLKRAADFAEQLEDE